MASRQHLRRIRAAEGVANSSPIKLLSEPLEIFCDENEDYQVVRMVPYVEDESWVSTEWS